MHDLTRRRFLLSLPALATAAHVYAQAKPQIRVTGFNHVSLMVRDVVRSLDFYQGLLGLPVQARQGQAVALRIGAGPQFLLLTPAGSTPPRIDHLGLGVDNFSVDRLVGILEQHGVVRAEGGVIGLGGRLMKQSVRVRGADAGGASEGTRELSFGDPDGLVVQLQDATYCGGGGVLGNLARPEPSPRRGLFAVSDISHFTSNVPDPARTNRFYQDLFGLGVRSTQGATLGLGIGPGVEFLMFAGIAGAPPASPGSLPIQRPAASINHVCLNMETFNVEAILKALEGYGVTPRGETPPPGPVGPMKSYVTLRMPNRGGAPGGTPELYFTDPDGLLVQLQDVRYCGGGGYLGNEQCR